MSYQEAARVLTEHAGVAPRVGIVLGSGLGAVADAVVDPTVVDYAELPGFPRVTVEGHGGRAVLGRIGKVPVAVLQGRAHVYEGGDFDAIRTPVRALRAAGAEILVLTNAAGSLRPDVGPGRLMLISDHINLSGVNILAGPNDASIGPRFPSLRDAYDPELRERLHAAATELGIELAEASTSRCPARPSRRPPRSAPSRGSVATPSACRPSTRPRWPATPGCAWRPCRRSRTSPRG